MSTTTTTAPMMSTIRALLATGGVLFLDESGCAVRFPHALTNCAGGQSGTGGKSLLCHIGVRNRFGKGLGPSVHRCTGCRLASGFSSGRFRS
jgi:hypothetical protein